MSFVKDSALLVTASVSDSNSTLLDGKTVIVEHQAQPASTCTLDLTLWYRRLGHVNIDYVRRMVKDSSVLGLRIDSDVPPDPICEPCISGKQHRPPVPHAAQHRASKALDLVHTDVHGPLPVQTQEGYRYWIIFVDGSHRFWVAILFQQKSEAFQAFLRFKAFAERLTRHKIGFIRNDKGGEFMSSEWEDLCIAEGIQRQHTVRNEPH
jgi:hypothetical protein